ncbi:MAG: amino acid ABC transporter ATP-binding protein [Planctomycetia bacterium]|nr:amino acid ABC transporter ATP-binding protein [Planctomycetia bacterium]
MIVIDNLFKRHGKQEVLRGVSLSVGRGEVAVVVGPSGGGKSTLLRCINGLERFDAGRIVVGSDELTAGAIPSQTLQRVRTRTGMVFQAFHLFPHLSTLENVLAGPLYGQGKSRDEVEPEARRLLQRVGMAHKADARPEVLSGGEQQRVAIARALAVCPEAILFDEPTSALDPVMAGEVQEVIAGLARDGLTMIVVTHALQFARKVAMTVHVMHQGQLAESGPPEQIFDSPRSEAVKVFLRQAT